ncbi:MAG: type IV pilus biogenesis protein PilM [Rubripirellula sp.]
MVKKLAIDWDETELRMVAAQCNGSSVKVTHAAVVPIENQNVIEVLHGLVQEHDLGNTETLVAIGRGQAELRELQLPAVPDDELPDIVRFQAIRSFASAGDSATVDFLVTKRDSNGIGTIAAAIGPAMLNQIHETCQNAQLTTKRISLRPLASAVLYQIHHKQSGAGDVVLIDLLANDAEIVVLRNDRVVFVRTVRMPPGASTRGKALAGELKRSLVACGSTGSLDRVVLWGKEEVHGDDKVMLAEAAGSSVDVLDPFGLVDIGQQLKSELPQHVGRLAPLLGLLAADETHADRLIDFLNPRKRVEEEPNPLHKILMIGLPLAAALLIGFFAYRYLGSKDTEIASLKSTIAKMKPEVKLSEESTARTDAIDLFLDGNVNWLREMKRLAETMPPSDQMIIRSLTATSNPRGGGGTMNVEGAVTNPQTIKQFEASLRDVNHQVSGDGATTLKTKDSYNLGFNETIAISPTYVRNLRYEAINALLEAEATAGSAASEPIAESPADDPPDQPVPATNDVPATNSSEPQPETPATEPLQQAGSALNEKTEVAS